MLGGYHVVASAYKDRPRISERIRAGAGFGWHEHDPELFAGVEQFPTLDGVEAKLRAGAKVADVGCGHGISTVLMAKAYPDSQIYGFDYHAASILRALQVAEAYG